VVAASFRQLALHSNLNPILIKALQLFARGVNVLRFLSVEIDLNSLI
jgi:hypothetical protein